MVLLLILGSIDTGVGLVLLHKLWVEEANHSSYTEFGHRVSCFLKGHDLESLVAV